MKRISNTENLSYEKVWKLFQETDKSIKETGKQIKETGLQMKETDKKIRQLETLFKVQWGKLIEALVQKPLLKLFQQRGIEVTQMSRNIESVQKGKQMEIDVLMINGEELIVIEVKTTLRKNDVDDLLEKLKDFKHFFKQYKDYKVYGAVAGLKLDEASDKYAYRKGLFVLQAFGEENHIRILNDAKFKPVNFG
ncbi:MAG: hypothetical protein ABI723_24115 [Bacteroidia bacterium]